MYENLDALRPTTADIITLLPSSLVPSDFKTAIVKPLLKTKNKNKTKTKTKILHWPKYAENLPTPTIFLSNIFEKVILHILHAHLQENNLCNPFQSAYCTGHNTETVLLRVVNDMDEDKICVLLLLDRSAAFDTIDHQILLSRHETVFGIRSIDLQCFRS